MSRLLVAVCLGSVWLLSPRPSLAQGVDEFGAYGGKEARGAETSQDVAVEIRFGRYVPEVDSEFSGATPYRDTFGKTSRYQLGFEVDWQALRIPYVGTLGPGFGWGYTKSSAKALLADGGGRSAQTTSLSIMPMYLVGALRVDVLARSTAIPLAVYAKGGLGAAPWWVSGPNGVARAAGKKGQAWSYGLHWAVGGMLLLDFLDQEAARDADNSLGINNSYFFVEWTNSNLDCFGGSCMQVGANTWTLGFALEM